jgi:hypothetical protein
MNALSTARQGRIRFTLRTLLLLTAAIAFVLWVVPVSIDWCKWQWLRQEVARNFVDLHRTHSKPIVVMMWTGTQGFFLSNQVIEWSSGQKDAVIPIDAPVDRESIYVLPPGKWAKTPDDVLRIFRTSQ